MTNSNNSLKITVVTVTYNAEALLEQTILSIIEQDYSNIEYIIIDGGSTDGTVGLIKKYEEYISYWVSEEDNGIYDAMNKGIDQATGKWINFMNAGDFFINRGVLTSIFHNIADDINLVYGGVNAYYEDNDDIFYAAPGKLENIFIQHPYNHQASFLSTRLAKKYKFSLNYKYASDVNQLLAIYTNESIIEKVIDQPLVNFLMGGFWQQNTLEAHFEIIDIVRRYLENIHDIYNHASSHHVMQPIQHRGENLYFSQLFNMLIKRIQEIKLRYKKVVLYGYGHIGKFVASLLEDSLVISVDKNFDNKTVYNPEKIKEIDFDIILICVLGREIEVKKYLMNDLDIQKEQILIIDLE